LMPVSLDTLGLAETLENLVRDWQRRNPGITLSLRHDLPSDLGPSVTLAAYRVVQEGLINALRHAQATNIEINLEAQFEDEQESIAADPGAGDSRRDTPPEHAPQRMLITVTDDGIGLPGSWSRPGHFGLRGLTERVEHLGGHLTIGNRAPHGVSLTAEIPLVTAKMPTAVGT
jgi:two-component system, NarL family, sensor histidine kinase UhpB